LVALSTYYKYAPASEPTEVSSILEILSKQNIWIWIRTGVIYAKQLLPLQNISWSCSKALDPHEMSRAVVLSSMFRAENLYIFCVHRYILCTAFFASCTSRCSVCEDCGGAQHQPTVDMAGGFGPKISVGAVQGGSPGQKSVRVCVRVCVCVAMNVLGCLVGNEEGFWNDCMFEEKHVQGVQ
jgi:hypothetical protein